MSHNKVFDLDLRYRETASLRLLAKYLALPN